MASNSAEAAMSPSLRSTDKLPPSFDALIIPPQEPFKNPPSSSSSPHSSLSSSKSTVRAPAESKQESKIVSWILRRKWRTEAVRRVDVACRIVAVALCLISFSIMAADKNRGWTTDAFDFYKEYRYCLSVNVIGFVYAGFQAYAGVYHVSSKKHIIRRPIGDYFNFAMDQIMAYLLISASSSATARTNYWVTNWGSDPFPNMISGSVAVSFLAFLAFALSSLISAYNLFNRPI